ncbi:MULTISPECIES: gluconeogenesis factor YvcK family protein [Psychrobacillus]|uniref:Gluconeogenesis factor n=1 Tax=Psychrobacillus faecigallinarum TaxID=2762235 RepID=A0ABR8RCY9_9BACI|nr:MULTISPECIES: YvcK family protein [Psychrobacillus]MBD7945663.1 YvcK family protein [Psychrobacillus faecigallinarum]QEY22409.1 YvcK family protein [Psychrobacillus sp. AK 1817]QGM29294.1 uridine diphosphate-N-acetylglucosamine-binding protein YvcK [Bacillus sp. N3536]
MGRTKHRKKIVILGGGTGLSTLLRGLKKLPLDITAIVTVADDGGSSGRLRDDYDIPPPGDIRNVLAALSEVEPLVEEMFQFRFAHSSELEGHSLGNLMITALTSITGDFAHAITEMSRVLNIHGKVLPAANQLVTLHAEFEDKTIITGESKIPDYGKKIEKVFITPADVKPLPEAVNLIRQADIIAIGPGSLYTSILPNLLVEDIRKAVIRSKAKKVYICNLMTQAGETNNYTAYDHVKALIDHVGEDFLDTLLISKEEIPENVQYLYKQEMASPVKIDLDKLETLDIDIVKKDISVVYNGAVRHDAIEVAKWLFEYAGQ